MRFGKIITSFIGILSVLASINLPSPSLAQAGRPFDIGAQFTASGFQGDGEHGPKYIELDEAWQKNPHSEPACIKVSYKKFGVKRWGGVYWQNVPDNWGDDPGDDLSEAGYNSITFWVRGEKGGEMVEFKAGGINDSKKEYKDSFKAKIGKVFLKKEWEKYIINLEGKDLSSVIGGFCWVASQSGNRKGLTFYLDDIQFEYSAPLPPTPPYLDIGAQFTATGWMGDGEVGTKYVELDEAWQKNPQSEPACIKVSYKKFGPERWAGIYWQNEPDNWGDVPGEDLSEAGYNSITFWARGEKGGEMVEFKAGDIKDSKKEYKDSFQASKGRVYLGKDWEKYTIDLESKNLSSVIGGFCWVAKRAGSTFYIDDIRYIQAEAR